MPPKCTQLTCDSCGCTYMRTESYVRKSRARGRTKNYCSNECRHKGLRTQQPLVCQHCGTTFLRYLSEIRKWERKGNKRIFCSKNCERAFNQSNYVELTCPWCDKQFTVWPSRFKTNTAKGQRIFCSAQCRDAAGGEERKSAVEVACYTCGKLHRRIPAMLFEHNFCSKKCFSAAVHTWANAGNGRCGIRPDLGHFVRSTWEANYARILIAQGIAYEYESMTFRMGTIHYTPDFRVGDEWIEIKGWMRPSAAEKIRAFRAAYPNERLVIIDGPAYRKLEQEWAHRIPEWEYASGSVRPAVA